MTKFEYDFDLSTCYTTHNSRDYLSDLSHCTIAPGQSCTCRLKYNNITRPITFKIEYLSSQKKYSETYSVDLTAGTSMIVGKIDTKNEELKTISYTLQEMLQKDL